MVLPNEETEEELSRGGGPGPKARKRRPRAPLEAPLPAYADNTGLTPPSPKGSQGELSWPAGPLPNFGGRIQSMPAIQVPPVYRAKDEQWHILPYQHPPYRHLPPDQPSPARRYQPQPLLPLAYPQPTYQPNPRVEREGDIPQHNLVELDGRVVAEGQTTSWLEVEEQDRSTAYSTDPARDFAVNQEPRATEHEEGEPDVPPNHDHDHVNRDMARSENETI